MRKWIVENFMTRFIDKVFHKKYIVILSENIGHFMFLLSYSNGTIVFIQSLYLDRIEFVAKV